MKSKNIPYRSVRHVDTYRRTAGVAFRAARIGRTGVAHLPGQAVGIAFAGSTVIDTDSDADGGTIHIRIVAFGRRHALTQVHRADLTLGAVVTAVAISLAEALVDDPGAGAFGEAFIVVGRAVRTADRVVVLGAGAGLRGIAVTHAIGPTGLRIAVRIVEDAFLVIGALETRETAAETQAGGVHRLALRIIDANTVHADRVRRAIVVAVAGGLLVGNTHGAAAAVSRLVALFVTHAKVIVRTVRVAGAGVLAVIDAVTETVDAGPLSISVFLAEPFVTVRVTSALHRTVGDAVAVIGIGYTALGIVRIGRTSTVFVDGRRRIATVPLAIFTVVTGGAIPVAVAVILVGYADTAVRLGGLTGLGIRIVRSTVIARIRGLFVPSHPFTTVALWAILIAVAVFLVRDANAAIVRHAIGIGRTILSLSAGGTGVITIIRIIRGIVIHVPAIITIGAVGIVPALARTTFPYALVLDAVDPAVGRHGGIGWIARLTGGVIAVVGSIALPWARLTVSVLRRRRNITDTVAVRPAVRLSGGISFIVPATVHHLAPHALWAIRIGFAVVVEHVFSRDGFVGSARDV